MQHRPPAQDRKVGLALGEVSGRYFDRIAAVTAGPELFRGHDQPARKGQLTGFLTYAPQVFEKDVDGRRPLPLPSSPRRRG